MLEQAIRNYFSKVYPERSSNALPVARKGEDQRAAFLRAHLTAASDGNVLDIGCGDGKFAFDIFHEADVALTLSDLSPRFLNLAAARFIHIPGTKFYNGNGFDLVPASSFDMIVAVGVFDYWDDWRDRLSLLISQQRATIVFSVPRFNSARQLARYVWLRMHGIKLQAVAKDELSSILDAGVRPYTLDIVGDDFMVCLPKSNQ